MFRKKWNMFIWLYVSILIWTLPVANATDYPHNYEKNIYCTSCHKIHQAPGGRLTVVGGIVNLCNLCHNPTGQASQFTLQYSDEALPGTSGTSHGFEKPADNAGYEAQSPLDFNMANNLENGNIVCTTCHNVHNHRTDFPFLWVTRENICAQCHTPRNQTSPPYTSHPVGVTIPTTAFYSTPQNLELINNRVECLTCHGMHWTYSRQQIRGTAESGTTTCLTDTDMNWTNDALVGWEIKLMPNANPNYHNWYQRRTITSNTNNTVCWTDPVPDPITSGDQYVLKEVGSGDGYLLNSSFLNLCSQCHTFPNTGVHFDPAGPTWPGGEYGSDYAYTDSTGSELWPQARSGGLTGQALPASYAGTCLNCHWVHGWAVTTLGKGTSMTVDFEENLCFTCHDATGPSTKDIQSYTQRTAGHKVQNYSNVHFPTEECDPSLYAYNADPALNKRHVECGDCHNPHLAEPGYTNPPTTSNLLKGVTRIKVTNGPAGTVPTYQCVSRFDTTTPANEYEVCFKCHSSWTTLPSWMTDKAVEFNPNNESYHPVEAPGKNQTTAMANSLANASGSPKLTVNDTIWCSDCHASDDTPTNVTILRDNYTGAGKGPHGSNAGDGVTFSSKILRARYRTQLKPAGEAYNSQDFELCFICHWEAPFSTRMYRNYSNFRYHELHLTRLGRDGNAICKECHYNIHSTKLTYYPANRNYSRLVSFAPNVQGLNGNDPIWDFNNRECWLTCHGQTHNPENY